MDWATSKSPGAKGMISGKAILPLAALIILVGHVVWISRLPILFGPPIATLGIAAATASAFLACFIRLRRGYGRAYLLILAWAALTGVWMIQFALNTGLSGDSRSFANLASIYSFFPFLLLLQCWGERLTLRVFYFIAVAYVCVYAILAFSLLTMGQFAQVPALSVILQDPDRGRRLYSCTALIAFVLAYQLAGIRRGIKPLESLLLLGVTLYAIAVAQSRIASALYALVAMSVLIGLPVLRRTATRAYFFLFFGYMLVVLFSYDILSNFLDSLRDPSLSLRLQSFDIAHEFFADHPILGLGIPGDSSFFQMVAGFPYYPDDLGGLGLVATYGLVGMLWVYFFMRQTANGAEICDGFRAPEFSGAAHAGTFVILTTTFSHNIIAADGGLVAGLLFALKIHRDGLDLRKARPPSHTERRYSGVRVA